MNRAARRTWALAVMLAMMAGCQDPAAPDHPPPQTTESLALTVVTRAPVTGESLPVVHVAGAPAALAVQVTRSAFCATLATAGLRRETGTVTIVAQVGGNPAANCAPVPAVVTYGGLVTGLAAGSYRVQVYEAVGDAAPRLLTTTTATVLPPTA